MRGSWRFDARIGKTAVAGGDVLLVKPSCFMNNSGRTVAAVARYYKIGPGDMVVVADDADIEAGRIRIRPGGSSGGHRGVQSVADALGTERFARLRIGIGRPAGNEDLKDYVLGRMSGGERRQMDGVVNTAADAARCVIERGVEAAMNEYNGRRIVLPAEE